MSIDASAIVRGLVFLKEYEQMTDMTADRWNDAAISATCAVSFTKPPGLAQLLILTPPEGKALPSIAKSSRDTAPATIGQAAAIPPLSRGSIVVLLAPVRQIPAMVCLRRITKLRAAAAPPHTVRGVGVANAHGWDHPHRAVPVRGRGSSGRKQTRRGPRREMTKDALRGNVRALKPNTAPILPQGVSGHPHCSALHAYRRL